MTGRRSRSFDKIVDRYESNRGGEARGTRIAPDLAELLHHRSSLLEVGVGSGVVAKPLQELGFRVFGIDIAQQMLARARDRIGNSVVRGDAMNLPFSTGSIEQIVCAWMLHTVEDVGAVMSEIARVLGPEGRCLVVEVKPSPGNEDSGATVIRDLQIELGLAPSRRDVRTYARTADEAGLSVRQMLTSGPHRYETSLADTAAEIETRFSSWMWDVPDESWTRATAPVLERLRERPDLELPFSSAGYQEILVLSP